MARQVTVTLVDDTDPGLLADETVVFTVDGNSYEIDLSSGNASRFREEMAVWVAHARRTTGRQSSRPAAAVKSGRSAAPIDREQSAAIRAWAKRNGHSVSARGRISAHIIDLYNTSAGAQR
ncbi:histone-like nucleoid-structuring protein Lsr2 [Rhodococcus triatomae]|nr:LSR2 protein [Rhodococcus triatomae BKS 15-14]